MKLKEQLKQQIRDLSDGDKKHFAGLMEDLRYGYKVKGRTGVEMMQVLQDIVSGAEADTIDGLKTRLMRLDKLREYLLKSDLKGEEQRVVYKAYVKVQSAIKARKDQSKNKLDTLARITNDLGGKLAGLVEGAAEEFPLFSAGIKASKFLYNQSKAASDRQKRLMKSRTDQLRKDAQTFYRNEIGGPKQPGTRTGKKSREEGFYPNPLSGGIVGKNGKLSTSINDAAKAYDIGTGTKGGKQADSQEAKILRVISSDVKRISKYFDLKKIQDKDARIDDLEKTRETLKAAGSRDGPGSARALASEKASSGIISWMADHADEAAVTAAVVAAAKGGRPGSKPAARKMPSVPRTGLAGAATGVLRRGAAIAGRYLVPVMAGLDFYDRVNTGQSLPKATIGSAGTAAGGLLGGFVGGAATGAAGGAVLGPIGALGGGLLGGAAASIYGARFGGSITDSIYDTVAGESGDSSGGKSDTVRQAGRSNRTRQQIRENRRRRYKTYTPRDPYAEALKQSREEDKKANTETAGEKMRQGQINTAVDLVVEDEMKKDPSKMPSAVLPMSKVSGLRGLHDILNANGKSLGLLFPLDESISNVAKSLLGIVGSDGATGGSGGTGSGGSSRGSAGSVERFMGDSPAYGGVGSLSEKYESRGRSDAIGFDPKGGTSYGKYQIATRTGTMNKFMSYLKETNPTAYERLAAAGPADSGKNGRFAQEWKALSKEGLIQGSEKDFIKKTHYDVSMGGIKNDSLRKMIEGNKGLQDVVWSTAVQHGGAGGASIFNKSYTEGMSEDDLIKAVYAKRRTQFGGSPPNVRASVMRRFDSEMQEARAGAQSGKLAPAETPVPAAVPTAAPTAAASAADPFIIDPAVRKKNGRDLTPEELAAVQGERDLQKRQTEGNRSVATSEPLSPELSQKEREFIFGKEDPVAAAPTPTPGPTAPPVTGRSEPAQSLVAEIKAEKQRVENRIRRGERPDSAKLENLLERYDTAKTKRTPTRDDLKKAGRAAQKQADARTTAALERVAKAGDKSGAVSQDFLGKGPAKKDGTPADYNSSNYAGVMDKDPYELQKANRAKELGYDVVQDPDSGEWNVNDPSGEFENIYKAERGGLKPAPVQPKASPASAAVAKYGSGPTADTSAGAAQYGSSSSAGRASGQRDSADSSPKDEKPFCDSSLPSFKDVFSH